MPIISVYLSEELFQKLEKSRAGKPRSSFVVSILSERLAETEGSTPTQSQTPRQDDEFEKVHEYEGHVKEYEKARADPQSQTFLEIARWMLRFPSQRRKYGLDEFPLDYGSLNQEQKKKLSEFVYSRIEDKLADFKEKIEEYKLDGIRHERCLKLVGLSLKQLRKIHSDLWDEHERAPTISEFAAAIGLTYQKARNIISLLGRDYGFISEKERRRREAEEEEPE